MSVKNAKDEQEIKINDLTTHLQSSFLISALQRGTISQEGSLLESKDGKSSATIVTPLKQSEKISSGKKYDQGKPPLELLSSKALVEIARVMAYGKEKYDAHNWRGGLAWSRVIGAALRHITAFNDGEDKDPESGISHLAHASCCLMFLLEYEQTKKEMDDRYKGDK